MKHVNRVTKMKDLIIEFYPTDAEERSRRLNSLPNRIENATQNMGLCERHLPVVYEFKRISGGYKRPCNPFSIF